jgi:hypothetical protein
MGGRVTASLRRDPVGFSSPAAPDPFDVSLDEETSLLTEEERRLRDLQERVAAKEGRIREGEGEDRSFGEGELGRLPWISFCEALDRLSGAVPGSLPPAPDLYLTHPHLRGDLLVVLRVLSRLDHRVASVEGLELLRGEVPPVVCAYWIPPLLEVRGAPASEEQEALLRTLARGRPQRAEDAAFPSERLHDRWSDYAEQNARLWETLAPVQREALQGWIDRGIDPFVRQRGRVRWVELPAYRSPREILDVLLDRWWGAVFLTEAQRERVHPLLELYVRRWEEVRPKLDRQAPASSVRWEVERALLQARVEVQKLVFDELAPWQQAILAERETPMPEIYLFTLSG